MSKLTIPKTGTNSHADQHQEIIDLKMKSECKTRAKAEPGPLKPIYEQTKNH